jgi:sialate O-acetylesterase
MKFLNNLKLLLSACLLLVAVTLCAQIQLSPIFSDNMVLQQQTQAPLWGKSKPNKEIRIATSWNKKIYRSSADRSGNWIVRIETPIAGGPYTMN